MTTGTSVNSPVPSHNADCSVSVAITCKMYSLTTSQCNVSLITVTMPRVRPPELSGPVDGTCSSLSPEPLATPHSALCVRE